MIWGRWASKLASTMSSLVLMWPSKHWTKISTWNYGFLFFFGKQNFEVFSNKCHLRFRRFIRNTRMPSQSSTGVPDCESEWVHVPPSTQFSSVVVFTYEGFSADLEDTADIHHVRTANTWMPHIHNWSLTPTLPFPDVNELQPLSISSCGMWGMFEPPRVLRSCSNVPKLKSKRASSDSRFPAPEAARKDRRTRTTWFRLVKVGENGNAFFS